MTSGSNTKTAAQRAGGNPWVVVFAVGLGQFMVVLDISILTIALPTIAEKLDASLAGVEWTLIAYTLALTGLVPVFGRVSDVLGRKRLFIIGVLAFAGASLLASFSISILWLIGARVLQAFGGALITSNVLAIITDIFPAGERGAAMGAQTILISGGAAIGPTLGGFLVTHFGWQSVFLINVPVGVIAGLLAWRILPPLQDNRTMEPVDWMGAGLLMTGTAMLLLGLTKAPDWGWASVGVVGLLLGGLVVAMLFVLREQRARYPLVDLSLFKIREFVTGQTAGVFATIAMATVMLLFPFYWQTVRGYSAETAGLLLFPLPVTLMFVAPTTGWLSDKVGARGLTTTGLGIVIIALIVMSQITATMAVWDVLWRVMVLGVGLGTFLPPNNNSVMSSVPPDKRGIGAGLLGMFRYGGQSIGVAFAGTTFAAFATSGLISLHTLPSPAEMAALGTDPVTRTAVATAFTNGMRAAALLAIPLAAIGMGLSFVRGKKPSEHVHAQVVSDGGRPSFDLPQGDHS
ncbi:MAG TPA: MFS transporter [Dehalococcoidia bacterium]|nr:MFS transporter [Dehalococcoidia bacterium]